MNELPLALAVVHGLSYGLLLFMLAAGLTLIFSIMGVLNFAHGSFYLLGAYLAHQLSAWFGFAAALVGAPLALALVGAVVERAGLQRVRARGPLAELLLSFAVAMCIVEAVQVAWGRAPLPHQVPAALAGTAFTVAGTAIPVARVFAMGIALLMLGALWLVLERTRLGLMVRAARTRPAALAALGHDVGRLHTLVFAGGAALAGLAGAVGGVLFVTEPAMGSTMAALLFAVVVIGGLGSLAGAFVASLLVGLAESLGKFSELDLALPFRVLFGTAPAIALSQVAPLLPYVLLVAVLRWRPRGLLGARDG